MILNKIPNALEPDGALGNSEVSMDLVVTVEDPCVVIAGDDVFTVVG